MLIQNIDHSADTLGLDGEQYTALGAGVFDVPDAIAPWLTIYPHWRRFEGDVVALVPGLLEPVLTTEDREKWEQEAAELLARVTDEDPDDEQIDPASKPAPAKTARPKKTAAKAD